MADRGVGGMAGFLSYSLHRVDKKGRVSVPAQYRALLLNGDKSFICFPSLLGPWLQGVTPKLMQAFMERQNALGAFSGMVEAYPTLVFSQAVEMIPDTDGRIVLPAELLAHARIEEDIAFVGQGLYFSMWSPALFEEEKVRLRERALAERASWVTPEMAAGHTHAVNMTSGGEA
ncbi:MAG TPA: hypothetical protein DCO82_04655 [Alphaproteobacteria bacterium]|jgi:MraZ protein|nr:hypothetical protein [Alphaproteobacteria bacterium]